MSEMEISFPGGKKVAADWHGFEIMTDQPAAAGGAGSAPSPFDLFLASLGTCAGIFVLGFIQSRGLSTEGLKIVQSMDWDAEEHRMKKISFRVVLPRDFPDKYKAAAIKAAEQCLVKRTLHSPPEFEITAE
jgi:ribosomal protein S12 methylthiotransferase accessory factor